LQANELKQSSALTLVPHEWRARFLGVDKHAAREVVLSWIWEIMG